MRLSGIFGIAAIAGLCAVTHASAGPINLITNGSFEDGAAPSASDSRTLDAGGNILGWTVVQHNVDWVNGIWEAADGTLSMDLNGNEGPDGLLQTIETVPGQRYNLTFSLSGNPNIHEDRDFHQNMLVSLTVSAGSASADFDFNVLSTQDPSSMAWTQKYFTFTAQSSTTPIEFLSTTALPGFYTIGLNPNVFIPFNCCYGPVIDDVSVTVADVSEAPAIAFFGGGLFCFLMAGFKTRPGLTRLAAMTKMMASRQRLSSSAISRFSATRIAFGVIGHYATRPRHLVDLRLRGYVICFQVILNAPPHLLEFVLVSCAPERYVLVVFFEVRRQSAAQFHVRPKSVAFFPGQPLRQFLGKAKR